MENVLKSTQLLHAPLPIHEVPGHRESIFRAVAFACEQLLFATSWHLRVGEILDCLGPAADTSRIYLFENKLDHHHSLSTTYHYQWTAQGVKPWTYFTQQEPFPYQRAGLERWKILLNQGDVVSGCINDFPKREQVTLFKQNIESIVVQPIFANEQWWGFI